VAAWREAAEVEQAGQVAGEPAEVHLHVERTVRAHAVREEAEVRIEQVDRQRRAERNRTRAELESVRAGARHVPRLVRRNNRGIAVQRPTGAPALEAEVREGAIRAGVAPGRERIGRGAAGGEQADALGKRGGTRRNRKG